MSAARPEPSSVPPADRSPTGDSVAPADPASAPPPGAVEGIVEEIRREMMEISSHELDLRRREQEFAQEYRRLEQVARQAARAEVEQAQKRLAARSAALNAEAAEVASRRARLSELAESLQTQEERLVRARKELETSQGQLQQRADQLQLRFEAQRQALRHRIASIRTGEHELGKRVQLARDDLAQQREALRSQKAELDIRASRLAQAEQDLQARAAELERRLLDGNARVNDAEQQLSQITAQQARLAEERGRQQSIQQDLQTQRDLLGQRQQEQEQRSQAVRQQRQQVTRQAEELESRRRVLAQEQASLEERRQRVERREQQLEAKLTDLEVQRQRLEEAEAEAAQRRSAADEACLRAEEVERTAEQYQAESLALKEQTEAREAESRQAALSLELEKQELDRRRAALETVENERADRQARENEDIEQTRARLRDQAAELERAARASLIAPRHWWRRTAVVSAAAAVVAALGWFTTHPGRYQSTVDLQVQSVGPPTLPAGGLADEAGESADAAAAVATWARAVLDEHARALLDPKLVAAEFPASELGADWQAACVGGSARVGLEPASMRLRLAVIGADSARTEQLAREAATAYERRVNDVAPEANVPRQFLDLLSWRDECQASLDQLRQRQAALHADLSAATQPADRDATCDDAEDRSSRLTAVTARLNEQRSALAALTSRDAGPEPVAASEIESALGEDTVWREDRRELESVVRQYRQELLVALLVPTDPERTLEKALNDFSGIVLEQRDLSPPAELAGVLEACAAGVKETQGHLVAFAEPWRAHVEAVQSFDVAAGDLESSVVSLVERQHHAAEDARRAGEQATRAVDELGARIEALGQDPAGGTRAVVIAAVLRSEHANLRNSVEAFLSSAVQTSLAGNVRLEALDRQLRGLRTRMGQRRELVAQRLQREAALVAGERRAAQADELRGQIAQLEQQRDELAGGLLDAVRRLRELDAANRSYDELAGRARLADEQVRQVEARLSQLDRRLADARRSGPQPDRVSVGGVATANVGTARGRDAALAGGAALVATWLVSTLLAGRLPRPGRGPAFEPGQ